MIQPVVQYNITRQLQQQRCDSYKHVEKHECPETTIIRKASLTLVAERRLQSEPKIAVMVT
jgi:hypothetical protein